jgi:hypothetical protein
VTWTGGLAPALPGAQLPSLPGSASDGMFERARAYVAKMPPAIAGQGGHDATWSVARKCAQDFGLSGDQTLDILREFNTRCDPPWSDHELAHKAKDAAEKARVRNPVEERSHWRMPHGHYAPEAPPDVSTYSDSDAPDAPPSEETPIPRVTAFSSLVILESEQIFAELEPPEYLFAPIIARGSVAELIAYGASGKTWIAVDAALSVAAGVPFLERFESRSGRALYLDWENGSYELRRRLHAAARGRDLPIPVPGLALASMPSLYMTDPGFGVRLEPLAEGRDLLVIDTLRAASPGLDENDSRMRSGLDLLHRIGERTGCAFLVLAHAKKTSGSVTSIDPREAGRGSSAIFDAADTVLHLAYTEGQPLTVTHTKARSGRAVEPFQVEINDTPNGGVRVLARDLPSTGIATDSARLDALCDEVLEVVRANPGASGRVIRARVSGRPAAVLAALEVLERNGAIRNAGSPSSAKWFPIGGTP